MNLLDLLFPRRCVGCGKIGKYFCQKCSLSIRPITQFICPICGRSAISGITHPGCQTLYTLDGLTSFFHYGGTIRQAVKLLKYRFASDLTEEFIDLIPSNSLNQLTKLLTNKASLVPIPLHPSRLRFRGFNQAEVLGRFLAKRMNISFVKDILKRVKKSKPQVEMKDRKKRLSNMEGVFNVNNLTMRQFNNVTILLFDDVFTTGATLRSAANTLKRAGAKKIWGITLAHG